MTTAEVCTVVLLFSIFILMILMIDILKDIDLKVQRTVCATRDIDLRLKLCAGRLNKLMGSSHVDT